MKYDINPSSSLFDEFETPELIESRRAANAIILHMLLSGELDTKPTRVAKSFLDRIEAQTRAAIVREAQ